MEANKPNPVAKSNEIIDKVSELQSRIEYVDGVAKDINSINEIIPMLYVKDNSLVDLKNSSLISITPIKNLL